LKVDDHCSVCRLDFTGHRADDLPAYLVIVIVGHVLVTVILWNRGRLCTVASVSAWHLPSDFGLGLDISPATGQRRRGGGAMVAQDARLRRAPARRTPGLRRKMPQRNGPREAGASASNFIRSIIASDVETGRTRIVVTRFPPEPNGYLHLGSELRAREGNLAAAATCALTTRTQQRSGWSTSMRSSVTC